MVRDEEMNFTLLTFKEASPSSVGTFDLLDSEQCVPPIEWVSRSFWLKLRGLAERGVRGGGVEAIDKLPEGNSETSADSRSYSTPVNQEFPVNIKTHTISSAA